MQSTLCCGKRWRGRGGETWPGSQRAGSGAAHAPVAMAAQRVQWRLRREIPHAHSGVARAAAERAAVGRERDREHRLAVAGERRAAARHGTHAKQRLRLVDNGQHVFGAPLHAVEHGAQRHVDRNVIDVERKRPLFGLVGVLGRQQLVQQSLQLRYTQTQHSQPNRHTHARPNTARWQQQKSTCETQRKRTTHPAQRPLAAPTAVPLRRRRPTVGTARSRSASLPLTKTTLIDVLLDSRGGRRFEKNL